MKNEISLYVHIPFCTRKCIYCDFNSIEYGYELGRQYCEAIELQINSLATKFSTIYVGGGTPTALSDDLFEGVLKRLAARAVTGCEFTLEANPSSLNSRKLAIMRDCGVNRLSIGIQSLDPENLSKLTRLHTAQEAISALEQARKAGFGNISIDLMYGLWGQSLQQLEKELLDYVSLNPEHISAYILTYEPRTALSRLRKQHLIEPLDEALVALMYSVVNTTLKKYGYLRYEVSNHSKLDLQCRHNVNYWNNGESIGIGVGAVSYQEGVRSRSISQVSSYLQAIVDGVCLEESKEHLTQELRARETAAIKIRTAEGIPFSWFERKTGFSPVTLFGEAIESLTQEGLLEVYRSDSVLERIALSDKGFLYCDHVSSEFL